MGMNSNSSGGYGGFQPQGYRPQPQYGGGYQSQSGYGMGGGGNFGAPTNMGGGNWGTTGQMAGQGQGSPGQVQTDQAFRTAFGMGPASQIQPQVVSDPAGGNWGAPTGMDNPPGQIQRPPMPPPTLPPGGPGPTPIPRQNPPPIGIPGGAPGPSQIGRPPWMPPGPQGGPGQYGQSPPWMPPGQGGYPRPMFNGFGGPQGGPTRY